MDDSRPDAPPPPPAPAGTDLWGTVDALWAWLDAHQPIAGREAVLLRVLKLSEEVGEAAQAVIGATGQNPRKGVSPRGRTCRASCATWPSRPWWRCGP